MAAKAGEAETASVVRKPTSYVVLRRFVMEENPEFEVWEPVRSEEAKTPAEACKHTAKELGRAGQYRAVPASSWKGSVEIEEETVTVMHVRELP